MARKTTKPNFSIFLAFVIALVVYYLPSPLEPVLWTNPSPLRSLEGSLAANTALSGAKILHTNEQVAPESMAMDPEDGKVYASLGDGRVVSFSKDGEFVKTLFFVGGYLNSKGNSTLAKEMMIFCHEETVAGRLPWNEKAEKRCGRPLGIRLRKEDGVKFLYFIDAHHGIFKLKLVDLTVQHLVTQRTIITTTQTVSDEVSKLSIQFFNDLDISQSGRIYFTDSSYKHSRSSNRQEVLDGAPRGRVLQFDPTTNELSVLVCGLHFPNGIQIFSDEEPLSQVVVEAPKAKPTVVLVNKTITKRQCHDVVPEKQIPTESTDPDASLSDELTENENTNEETSDEEKDDAVVVPKQVCFEREETVTVEEVAEEEVSVPSEVAVSSYKNNKVSLLVVELSRFRVLKVEVDKVITSDSHTLESCSENGSLSKLLSTHSTESNTGVSVFYDSGPGLMDNIRLNQHEAKENGSKRFLVGIGSKSTKPFSLLWIGFQSIWLRMLVGKFVPMAWAEHLVPRYGFVIELDEHGEVTRSFQDPTGKVALISEAQRHPITGDLWLGSHSNPYVAIVPSEHLHN